MTLNTKATVAQSTQSAIPELNRTEKKQYFLLIETEIDSLTITIGEKTFNKIKEMLTKKIK